MLKKLQNLLFEDEEDDEEEEFEPETLPEPPVRTAPVQQPAPQPVYQQPAPQPAPAPVQYERPVYSEPVPAPQPAPQKTMQIIDVTQPLPVINPDYPAPAPQPVRAQSVFAEETRQPAPAPKKTLGIVADAAPAAKPVPQPVAKPAPAPVAKPAKPTKPARPAYNFKPVISPIFGVDDKDMNSVKTVTSRINAKEQASKMEGNITPIISPMYGSNTEESIIAPKDVRKTAAAAVADIPADDDVPDFSLDDILAVGDEKYAEEKRVVDEAPLFPDLEFDDEVETPAKKFAAKDTL